MDAMLDALESAEARAWRSEERTRAFLADAAHELRTPLAGLASSAETLLQSELDDETHEQLLSLLVRESRRAGRFLDGLLTVARLEMDPDLARSGPPTEVDLATLARTELDRVSLMRPGLSVSVVGATPPVVTDREAVATIVRNLVENAARAAGPEDAIRLTLEAQPQHQPQHVLVVCEDTGPGVPEQDRERVFDRLVRLDTARQADPGGSGLGLALSRAHARALGGDLVCRASGDLGGAAFVLTLPTSA